MELMKSEPSARALRCASAGANNKPVLSGLSVAVLDQAQIPRLRKVGKFEKCRFECTFTKYW